VTVGGMSCRDQLGSVASGASEEGRGSPACAGALHLFYPNV